MRNLTFAQWYKGLEDHLEKKYREEFGDFYDPDDYHEWIYEQYEIARDDAADMEHERKKDERDE